ncbi:hypothetical protein SLEP1_g1541 [Rubroshorea leprosula]|uniref:PGG domain-containing protein n=1 Tax=Rubroshorea leprosula TaxID=152421 RepID=A0AAV5HJW4_9ROSI|nr:hypothetical protein SLEP1_g1541 [Rubroshorea leprosula]
MDERMRDVAEAGDIEALYALIQENSFVLESIDRFPFVDTPLHIAASKGHIDFAMEMMNLKPSYARKLNPAGLSPMHLALLNCQIHVLRELLKVDKDLVRVKGRGSLTPLHHAVEKGDLDLIAEFLEACPECITDVTIHGQNAIHIAISNDNFETLELLVCWLEKITHKDAEIWNKQVLNGIDRGGNTVLHIAASINHPQMVRLLLECKMISKNKVNLNCQSALDMLSGQVNSSETANILRQAGCLEAERIPTCHTLAESLRTRMSCSQKLQRTMVRQNNMISSDMRNAMLVVAVLILTTTYQTCLTPPGGVWQGNLGDPVPSRLDISPLSAPSTPSRVLDTPPPPPTSGVFPSDPPLSKAITPPPPPITPTLRNMSAVFRNIPSPSDPPPFDPPQSDPPPSNPPPSKAVTNAPESMLGLSIMSTPNFIYFYFINTATFLTTTTIVFLLLPDNTINLLALPILLFILCYLLSMTYLAPFPIPNSPRLQPFAPIIIATLLFLVVCLPKFFNLNLQS